MQPRHSAGFPTGAYTAWREVLPLVRASARWWGGFEAAGDPPPEGPIVVSANHLSHVDPVVVSLAIDRPVRYLALDELFGHVAAFDALILWLGSIPLTRTGVPLSAMKTALRELEAGGTVGVFPEGRRVAAWGDEEPKGGGAWLARRAGVPLVPVAVWGTDGVMGLEDRRLSRHPVRVTVCQPIHPADFEADEDPVQSMTQEWERRVGAALEALAREG